MSLLRLICIVGLLAAFQGFAFADEVQWALESHPYRLRLKLEQPVDKPVAVAVNTDEIIYNVANVAVDQVDFETFAFEQAVFVNPATGKKVGRFELVRCGPAFDIDGSFNGVQRGESAWQGFSPDKMEVAQIPLGGNAPQSALLIEDEKFENAKLSQRIHLQPGQQYLLEYWIMMDAKDSEMGVMIYHPNHRLFGQVRHSYVNRMPPPGEWAHHREVFRAESPAASGETVSPIDVDLQITHAFVGKGGVAGVQLQPVKWQLVLEPDVPTDEVDLYVVGRAGHRLTVPTENLIATEDGLESITATIEGASRQNLNPDGVLVAGGNMTAWTIDPALPMKVGAIRSYLPAGDKTKAARVDAFRGGSASLVIAVDASAKRLPNLTATCDLPVDVRFHRLAKIPVYDGATVNGVNKGRLIETRYDAMVPLDYALDPDSEDGMHLIVATITPRDDTRAGNCVGQVIIQLGTQQLVVPVELRVAPLVVEPKLHFGSSFGATSYLLANRKGTADMADDAISIATFHGLQGDALNTRWSQDLNFNRDPSSNPLTVRALAERYFHTMLDNHLLPRCPDLYLNYSCKVVDQGEGLAPRLTEWDFLQGFDQAIHEFVIGRKMPWFTVYHSNGYLMNTMRLCNGTTYSVDPNPTNLNWVQLSREQFDQLVGDYFDAVARHLDELGVLDRALFVVDESGFDTYETIYAYVKAFKSRPYARHIKVGNTIDKASAWTHRLPNGKLILDEAIDVPMPLSDEHCNYFEPEWNSRFKRPGKIQWVYNVESDHLNLENAGLSTVFLPLRLQHLGVSGWYDWESFIWSLPYPYLEGERGGFKYGTGPVGNPWVNPFYHHGPGVLSFFYPPDPRGPAAEPTMLVIPSYRLTLMRDGIQDRALLEVLQAGRDDGGHGLKVSAEGLREAQAGLETLWPENPVQWYLGYDAYRTSRQKLHDLAMASSSE